MYKDKDFPFLPTPAFLSSSLAIFIVIDIDVNRMTAGLLGNLGKHVGYEE
jgi:hypothetical protein